MKVTVDQAFWDLFPQAKVVVMTVEDIDNHVDESKDPILRICSTRESYDQKNILMKISSLLVQSFRNGDRLLPNLRPKKVHVRQSKPY